MNWRNTRRSRRSEGAALAQFITAQLDAWKGSYCTARVDNPARTPRGAPRPAIAGQIAASWRGGPVFDVRPPALEKQVLIATRAISRKEIDRLGSHIAPAFALLAEGGAVGRRLDFLAQNSDAGPIAVVLQGLGCDLVAGSGWN